MKKEITSNIEEKTGVKNLAELLSEGLPGSGLNSLLLDVFDKKTQKIAAAGLLKHYMSNRLVHPSRTDMIGLLKTETAVLEFLRDRQFTPIELSPVAQLGSCSVLGPVDQKKIISGVRSTEVLADATNSIALHIAQLKKSGKTIGPLHFCTVHRHLRTQPLLDPNHSAHFKISCMVSSGKDTGDYRFECENLQKHIITLNNLMQQVYGITDIKFRIINRKGYPAGDRMVATLMNYLKIYAADIMVFHEPAMTENNYYKGVQFKMIVKVNGAELEIADGGFVDWTQQLLQNTKERLLISGCGLELLYKLQHTAT